VGALLPAYPCVLHCTLLQPAWGRGSAHLKQQEDLGPWLRGGSGSRCQGACWRLPVLLRLLAGWHATSGVGERAAGVAQEQCDQQPGGDAEPAHLAGAEPAAQGRGPQGGLLPSSSSKGFPPGPKAATLATSRTARKVALVTKLVALSACTSLGLIFCLVLLYLFPPSFSEARQPQQLTPQPLPLNATHDQLLLEALEQARVAPEAIAALGLDVSGGAPGAHRRGRGQGQEEGPSEGVPGGRRGGGQGAEGVWGKEQRAEGRDAKGRKEKERGSDKEGMRGGVSRRQRAGGKDVVRGGRDGDTER